MQLGLKEEGGTKGRNKEGKRGCTYFRPDGVGPMQRVALSGLLEDGETVRHSHGEPIVRVVYLFDAADRSVGTGTGGGAV